MSNCRTATKLQELHLLSSPKKRWGGTAINKLIYKQQLSYFH
uniref:Uncharacterized protein n=1 Tax=Arundo donax TaxID=35708 RepID=A0A0A9ABD0_ARUDO